jgi:hypothetical protein
MNKDTALRLLKDLNMIICQTNEWADMDEEDFLIILKNYIEVEE